MKQSEIKKLFEDADPQAFETVCSEYGEAGRFAYELFQVVFMNRKLYGVLVLLDGKSTHYNECFDTRLGADIYIRNLGEKT